MPNDPLEQLLWDSNFGNGPVNQQGTKFNVDMFKQGVGAAWEKSKGAVGDRRSATIKEFSEMFVNWLTVGGAPKKVDPGMIFKEQQDLAGIRTRVSAGQGVAGLFGFGSLIGDLQPALKPINQSPMQTGVPYSALPVPAALPKVGG